MPFGTLAARPNQTKMYVELFPNIFSWRKKQLFWKAATTLSSFLRVKLDVGWPN